MKTGTRLGLTLLGAYAVFLIATVPAPLVLGKLGSRIAPLALYDVSGSLWSGHAGRINYAALRAANLNWSLHPLALLLGHLEAGVSLDDPALHGSGALGSTLGGTRYLSTLNASADLQALQASGLLRIPLPVNGQAQFALRNLRFDNGKLNAADGTIDIKGVATLVPVLTLGDFQIKVETQQSGIKATLTDRGGALRAEGVALISPDGRYQFSGKFSARDPNQANLQQYLRMLGPMGQDGRVGVTTGGQL